jgi:glycosyltransferase involved in cell wall biosynthesis
VAVATHPIQYQAPLFRALARSAAVEFEAAFVDLPDAARQGEGFGIPFQWDIPVLDGYPWTCLPSWRVGPAMLHRALRARARIRDLRADVIMLMGWHSVPMVQVLFAAAAEGVPVLMRGDSNALRKRGPLVRFLHRRMLRRVSAFLVVGRANRDFYRSYGVPESHLFVSPHFIENARFAADARELRGRRPRLREEFGIRADSACFLFAGKFESKKRPRDLIEALALVRQRRPDLSIQALFVGAGALGDELRSRAESTGVDVRFAGFLNQTEIAKAYVASDALVLPSDYGETWGLVVNEAMACGLPALVSDRVGCGPDLIVPGETGEAFPFGDIAALASVLERWASAQGLLRAMGERAEQHVNRHFTLEQSVEAIVSATRQFAQGRSAWGAEVHKVEHD